MASAETLRALALALPGAAESAHMGHPDFRVQGRIFASLDRPGRLGHVKLTPDQQEMMRAALPGALAPASGAWGARGWTRIALVAIGEEDLAVLLRMAHANVESPRRGRA
ncbi:MAG TPA: MmcQ/YjbR family DNA-binding protein [Paracoccaceae bacterium]|nr:MmcQ/YjbR family DNA-binding protein [Paracoccaceae bacterium]